MIDDIKENINCIKQTAENRYRIILDFATVKIVPFILNQHYKYVWVYNHNPAINGNWREIELPILESYNKLKVLSKNIKYDFIIETARFSELIPNWNSGIQLVQINKIPPEYLDLNRIKGNERYNLLQKECDYLFDLEIPSATDYGCIISPNLEYMQSLIESTDINWNDLP